jgi:hypothetical protein
MQWCNNPYIPENSQHQPSCTNHRPTHENISVQIITTSQTPPTSISIPPRSNMPTTMVHPQIVHSSLYQICSSRRQHERSVPDSARWSIVVGKNGWKMLMLSCFHELELNVDTLFGRIDETAFVPLGTRTSLPTCLAEVAEFSLTHESAS